ncbi:MAG: MotA/TolQ/ExbB proton channel family protein [Planctomycetaceae bacterium]
MSNGLDVDRRTRQRARWLVFWCLSLSLVLFPLCSGVSLHAQDDFDDAGMEGDADGGDRGAAGRGGADPGTAELPPEESWLTWLVNASGPFGAMIGIESVILVALIVTNILQLRMQVFVPPEFVEAFEQKLQAKDYQGAYELARKDDSFLARVLAGGLARLSRGYDEAVTGMQQVADDESMTIDHKLSYISIIGTTSPMLGLLGTVQGMVQAFGVIARSTVSPKPSELASGITLALVTTLEGLIVAIPAVIAFALFKNRQARLVLETGMVADNLMSRFASVGKRPGAGGPGTSTPAAPER